MIIIEKPYVSELLVNTLSEKLYPVLKNEVSEYLSKSRPLNLIESSRGAEDFKNGEFLSLYSNSEDSLDWVAQNLSFSDFAKQAALFKDKVTFRKETSGIFDDVFFMEVAFDDLASLEVSAIRKPFIVKPSVGFFSIGVHRVDSDDDWPIIVKSIMDDAERVSREYPGAVIDSGKFIIEEITEGEEYAIDTYFNDSGEPVVLNILHHIFSSGADVKDRVYNTSAEIIEGLLPEISPALVKIGNHFGLKNFPMHIEIRVDDSGKILPIEINPLRFAGWCTTDLAYYAYGINVYEYFMEQKKPQWDEIFKDKRNKLYSVVIADIPSDVDRSKIESIEYDDFIKNFSGLIEMRKIDYNEHPVFGFAFIETDGTTGNELDHILREDMGKYIVMKG